MLRPYQQACLRASVMEAAAGVRSQLIVAATGLGKTVILARLPDAHRLAPGRQMMVLTHRDELVRQTYEKLRAANPTRTVEVEKAEQIASPTSDIVVASVQTLGRKVKSGTNQRLAKFKPGNFDIIVVDEVHHCTSDTYMRVLAYMHVLRGKPDYDSSKLLVGVTATPSRSDSKGLGDIFEKIVYEYGVRPAIKDGWLAAPRGFLIQTETDISKVKVTAGDFNDGDLGRYVNTPARNAMVVREYVSRGEGMPALAFAASIQHAKDLAAEFDKVGIPCMPVWGDMPDGDRRMAFDQFRRGRMRVLTSAQMFSEGVDLPIASVALMCRPTRSQLRFAQEIGRVLRPYPAPEDAAAHTGWRKPYAIVMDFCDLTGRHSIITAASMLGLRPGFDPKGLDLLRQVEEIERLQSEQSTINLSTCGSLEEVRSAVTNVDLMAAPVISPLVKRNSQYEWLERGDGMYQLLLANDKTLLQIEVNTLGTWVVYRSQNGQRAVIHACHSLPEALRVGDALVPLQERTFKGHDRKWKSKAPSLEACRYLLNLNPQLRAKYDHSATFHAFAVAQHKSGNQNYSAGAISRLIDQCKMKQYVPKGGQRHG